MKDNVILARLIEQAHRRGLMAADGLPRVIDLNAPGQAGLWFGWPLDVLVDGIVVNRVFYANRRTGEVRRFVDHLNGDMSLVATGRLRGVVVAPARLDDPHWERLDGRVEFRWKPGVMDET